MRTFTCACGARIFFDNWGCVNCGRQLGFLAAPGLHSALEQRDELYEGLATGLLYRKCLNYEVQGVCNWMVPAWEETSLCQACRLNRVIPDLSVPENRKHWSEVERAKRRLVYSLNRLQLPVLSKWDDPERGLAFDIRQERPGERVLTGHADGLVTLNLLEANAIEREKMRIEMNERYRTLLGHFRHEVGHYYWDMLIRDSANLDPFREMFGDERMNYQEALERHYSVGPADGFEDSFISSYATAHPWEDWAESWAHYLHIMDTLETAQHFGFTSTLSRDSEPLVDWEFNQLIAEWIELTIALNALNRSMGLPDAYPFAISQRVTRKLRFIHSIVNGAPASTS
jgi:hypothetical protein